MGIRGLFDSPSHLIILVLVIVVVFGWKRLPDAARSLGRSARILKSEMGEMAGDSKASGQTVKGEAATPQTPGEAPIPGEAPAAQQPPQQPTQPAQPQYQPPRDTPGTGGPVS